MSIGSSAFGGFAVMLEIDEHGNNVSDFEFGVAKLIKNTKHKCCLAQNCIIINTNSCLLKSDSNAPKSFFGFQNVRASNSLFNIDGNFTVKDINMTHSSNSLPKHKTGLDNVLPISKLLSVSVANAAKSLISAGGEIAEQTGETTAVDMDVVRRFEEHAAH
ncbi:hypothetical protein TYRP_011370 [Tyrophagus putrescentiae]|nr:hypothetical protein TYRP_011370 [Tyrophagus putrescentiae]